MTITVGSTPPTFYVPNTECQKFNCVAGLASVANFAVGSDTCRPGNFTLVWHVARLCFERQLLAVNCVAQLGSARRSGFGGHVRHCRMVAGRALEARHAARAHLVGLRGVGLRRRHLLAQIHFADQLSMGPAAVWRTRKLCLALYYRRYPRWPGRLLSVRPCIDIF